MGGILGEVEKNLQEERDGKLQQAPRPHAVLTKPKPATRTSFLEGLALADALDSTGEGTAVPAAVSEPNPKKPKKPKKPPQQQQQPETAPDLAADARILGEFALVETADQCAQALERIRSSGSVVFVDCEGVNLGRNGRLCLVQVCTLRREAFLFDVVDPAVLAATMDAGLRALLESQSVLKVFHDCRSDSDALWHCAHVRLQHVFDTQIAHAVLTRQQTGKAGHCAPIPASFSAVVARYGKGTTHESKSAMHATMVADREFWARRPLSQEALLYASTDVLLLPTVHKSLVSMLAAQDKKFVAKFSEMYAAQVRDSADGKRVSGGDDSDVPLYGILEFDVEVLRTVDYLRKKGVWHRNRTPSQDTALAVAAEAAAPQPPSKST